MILEVNFAECGATSYLLTFICWMVDKFLIGQSIDFYWKEGKPLKTLVGLERNFQAADTYSTVQGILLVDTDQIRDNFSMEVQMFIQQVDYFKVFALILKIELISVPKLRFIAPPIHISTTTVVMTTQVSGQLTIKF